MFRLLLLVIAICALSTACQPGDLVETPALVSTPSVEAVDTSEPFGETNVGFSRNGLSIELPRPDGWESFTTDYGVVIAEEFGTVADHGELQGLMAYIFVTPLDEFPFDISPVPGVNHAHQVLSGILADADSRGSAHVTEAFGFNWADHDAAYYLLSEPATGLRTLVIGVSLPQFGVLLTCAVSAPHELAGNIRTSLPFLLGGLILNAQLFSADDLHSLPEMLDFPE